jgi:hypothetical protein
MPSTPSSREDDNVIQYNHPSAPQVGRWVRHHVFNQSDEHGDCYKFVIKHITVNKKANGDVGEVKVDPHIRENNGLDHLIDEICTMAQQDANAMREGVQTYGIFAYYRKSDFTPRTYFRVAAEEAFDQSENNGHDPSEPATERGHLAQMMRHNEALARLSVVNTQNLIETLMRDNASQRAVLEKQGAQIMDAAALIQESLDNSTARRIAEKEAATKQELVGSMLEHVKLMLPVIVNKLAGQKITPESDPSFTLLASLFESLTREQQQRLFTELLSPSQAAVLAEFVDTYEKRKRTLTSKPDQQGQPPPLNLGLMFDKTEDRLRTMDTSKSADPQLTSMETRAQSFKTTFARPLPSIGLPIRPAK